MSGKAQTAALEALVEEHTQELHLPTVRRRFRALAAEAAREQQTRLAYLAALLGAEVQERAERRERRRLLDARFPLLVSRSAREQSESGSRTPEVPLCPRPDSRGRAAS